jgi:PD-(D/E)XK endonuclease
VTTRGDICEGAVLGTFTKLGLVVLVPWRHDLPYDLVVHLPDERFVRVQCKTGRERGGSVLFNSASTDHGQGRRDYRGRADVLAVFCPTLDRVFVVPVDEAAGYVTSLRVDPPRNGQRLRVRLASDHTAERWAATVLARAAP